MSTRALGMGTPALVMLPVSERKLPAGGGLLGGSLGVDGDLLPQADVRMTAQRNRTLRWRRTMRSRIRNRAIRRPRDAKRAPSLPWVVCGTPRRNAGPEGPRCRAD